MKKLNLKFLPIALIGAFLLFLASCQTKDLSQEISESAATVSDVELEAIPAYDIELLEEPALQPATIDREMDIISDGLPEELDEENPTMMRDSSGHRKDLMACLQGLDLTQGQKDSIRVAAKHLHRCREYHITAIRTINRSIISQANLERKALIAKYRRGEITRSQLVKALQKLNKRTRYALTHNPEKMRHIKALRACFKNYLRALHHILNPEQWESFKTCYTHGG